MNELKATCGPWFASEHDDYVVRDQCGVLIADCDWGETSNNQMKANAALIAAAPELYSALEELVSRFLVRNDEGSYAHQRAKAALKKARGEA